MHIYVKILIVHFLISNTIFFYIIGNIVNTTIPNLEGTCLFAFFASIGFFFFSLQHVYDSEPNLQEYMLSIFVFKLE